MKEEMQKKHNSTSDGPTLSSDNLGASRHDLHLPRRLFHFGCGFMVATIYDLLMTHQQAVSTLGTFACVFYIFEQFRVNYPEHKEKFNIVTKHLIRAEEQLKESSSIPYVIAIFLTLLTCPKVIALSAIYTLAIADPISAIVGITKGRKKILPGKTVEGSAAFFVATFFSIYFPFSKYYPELTGLVLGTSFAGALLITAFEMIPFRVDDNITIPVFTAFALWMLCLIFGIPVIPPVV